MYENAHNNVILTNLQPGNYQNVISVVDYNGILQGNANE